MKLYDLREEYTRDGLEESDLHSDPVKQFEFWFEQARKAEISEVNAMALATVDERGQPWQRHVLLKYFDQSGFVFFTNYESRKAGHMAANAKVSLLFFWKELQRQVHITGRASQVGKQESLRYFLSRPHGSQLGAWVSDQSSVISSRKMLMMKFEEMKRKFSEGKVPLPDHWGGYRVEPDTMEFWQGRENRLHDRFLYSKLGDDLDWRVDRLAP